MHRSFCVKELIPGYLSDVTGEYATPSRYFVDEEKAEEFDKTFPKKEKKTSGTNFLEMYPFLLDKLPVGNYNKGNRLVTTE